MGDHLEMSPSEAVALSKLLRKVATLEAQAVAKSEKVLARRLEASRMRPNPQFSSTVPPPVIATHPHLAHGVVANTAAGGTQMRPCYPTVRLGQSARAFAERQRTARAAADRGVEKNPAEEKQLFVRREAGSLAPQQPQQQQQWSPPRPQSLTRKSPPKQQKQFALVPGGPKTKTRCVLWPEYATLGEGGLMVHVEQRHKPATKGSGARTWRLLQQCERVRRRLEVRCAALERCGAMRAATVRAKRTGHHHHHHPAADGDDGASVSSSAAAPAAMIRRARLELSADAVVVESLGSPREASASRRGAATRPAVATFAVQVGAHAHGSLFIDTLFTTAAQPASSRPQTSPMAGDGAPGGKKTPPPRPHELAEGLLNWLQGLGMPPMDRSTALDLAQFEADCAVADRQAEDAVLNQVLAVLVGAAAHDVTFGALTSALKSAAKKNRRKKHRHRPSKEEDEDDDEEEDLAMYSKQAYSQVKHRVVATLKKERATEDLAPPIVRLAMLVADEHIDLQDVFLDTPAHMAPLRDDVRVTFADLRKGLGRLLGCLPPRDLPAPPD